jgi:hypothetical protein
VAKELSAKWRKFIAAYDGDVKAASAIAEINYSYARRVIVADPRIMDAVRVRNVAEGNKRVAEVEQITEERQQKNSTVIATRQQRQTFWTDVMEDADEDMKNRLRAAELLGKSEADFTEKVEHTGKEGGPLEFSNTERAARLATILERGRQERDRQSD